MKVLKLIIICLGYIKMAHYSERLINQAARPAFLAIEKKIDFLSASRSPGESYSAIRPLSSTTILYIYKRKNIIVNNFEIIFFVHVSRILYSQWKGPMWYRVYSHEKSSIKNNTRSTVL
jgi:hypothetical protein